MKAKTFVILVAICAALGAVAYYSTDFGKKPVQQSEKTAVKLWADLPINDIAEITITSPEGAVNLKKGPAVWGIENRFGYPADFDKLTEFVKKLREMKAGRSFTATDEVISRLALRPPDQEGVSPEQKAKRVTLKDEKGKILSDLLIGNAREASAGQGGHYLMLAGAKEVHLVDADFKYMEIKARDWLKQDLLDVKADDVKQVVCRDPKTGEILYAIGRPEKGKPPEFINTPDGKKIAGDKVNNLFSVLTSLRIEDVGDPQTPPDKTGFDTGRCLEFQKFDGTFYTICPGNPEDQDKTRYYFKAAVSYVAPEPQPPKPVETKDADQPDKADAAEKPAEVKSDEKTPADLSAAAQELNQKISPWVYLIPQWKYNRMLTTPDDYFEKAEAENKPAS
jgi:hypothetical protein